METHHKITPTKSMPKEKALRTCANCAHFRQVSIAIDKRNWGDCQKPDSTAKEVKGIKIGGNFTWDDRTCRDFKPRSQ